MTPIEIWSRVFVGLPKSMPPPAVKTVVYTAAEIPPNRGAAAFVVRCPLEDVDQPLDLASERMIAATLRAVRKRFEGKQSLMFICGPGLNRSTLVAALLVRQSMGLGAEGLISQFKQKLGPAAMTNDWFLQRIRKPITKL